MDAYRRTIGRISHAVNLFDDAIAEHQNSVGYYQTMPNGIVDNAEDAVGEDGKGYEAYEIFNSILEVLQRLGEVVETACQI